VKCSLYLLEWWAPCLCCLEKPKKNRRFAKKCNRQHTFQPSDHSEIHWGLNALVAGGLTLEWAPQTCSSQSKHPRRDSAIPECLSRGAEASAKPHVEKPRPAQNGGLKLKACMVHSARERRDMSQDLSNGMCTIEYIGTARPSYCMRSSLKKSNIIVVNVHCNLVSFSN
jgi:hypothetical protein